ncbi:MAG: hypothetical protein COS76_01260 [Candidatus Portnoybacteria bacterium CG06_land_8_20_14_3_00_39_12]|uniref:Methyltransferase type 11 domain-containing protein n=2 Tax=Candidatus Portnoyibacteriota TaxID=1817913 RepID=A0A2M8KFI9_9BACT|nr:MAG: hypothetical protein AUJ33_00430 [Parcubacteria group bacterium CG1_02_40_25]PIU75332.1 MAG: hypothetical protein COS76_01260 [Candidatus Portnoybacteria bacterium CG06_land_8_20_14_3_00_39_12]PJE58685.1 MAG: hypothetical protein COU83_02590 [Candidatus Portnoybacteria bacterium CG10_big_fil_rev_8_21_14_0_10_40_22]
MSKSSFINQRSNFWDKNPCGGQWLSFKQKRDWLIKTEPYILDFIHRDWLKDKKVLDVGCGQGLILSLMAQECPDITGIDLSRKSLLQANKGLNELGLKHVKLAQGNAENLPFNDNVFDLIYCIGVLHHTPNIQKGIAQINRVLKEDGQAIIMLYRKYTPKWLAVIILRSFSALIDKIAGQKYYLANKLRHSKKFHNQKTGTALLELFGCPILKTYSSREIKKLFHAFKSAKLSYAQPGFQRLMDFLPRPRPFFSKISYWLDRKTKRLFGFYVVIEVKK